MNNTNIVALLALVTLKQSEPTSANITALHGSVKSLTLEEALTLLPEAKTLADNCPSRYLLNRQSTPEAELAELLADRCVTTLADAIRQGLDPVFPTGMTLSTLKEALKTGRDGYPTLQVSWGPEDRRILGSMAQAVRASARFDYENFLNLTKAEIEEDGRTVAARHLLAEWYGCFGG